MLNYLSSDPLHSAKAKNRCARASTGLMAIFLLSASGCKSLNSQLDSGNGSNKPKETPKQTYNGAPDATVAGKPSVSVDPNAGKPVDPAPTTSGLCRFLDPVTPITEVVPGSPAGVLVPISEYLHHPELLTAVGSDISFNYTIFQRQDGTKKTLTWDGVGKGWFAVNYRGTIKTSDSAKCTISAVATSKPEERTMRGCFDPSTLITMADGSHKKIDDIKLNEHVLNPLTKSFGIVVRITKGPEAFNGMFEIGTNNGGLVLVTSKHPFLTRAGLKQADELTKHDEIITTTGAFKKIDHITKRAPNDSQRVVNIALAGATLEAADHMVEADGIVAGDLFLQEKLEGEKHLRHSIVTSK